MGAIIFRQPNGRLCRFSTVSDSITHYNMTEKEFKNLYVKWAIEKAYEEVNDILNNHIWDYEDINRWYYPFSMPKIKFDYIKSQMESEFDEPGYMKVLYYCGDGDDLEDDYIEP